jgi:hypothetical protein
MWVTEAFLLAALVFVVGSTILHCMWPSVEEEDKGLYLFTVLAVTLAVFLVVTECVWMYRIYTQGAGA